MIYILHPPFQYGSGLTWTQSRPVCVSPLPPPRRALLFSLNTVSCPQPQAWLRLAQSCTRCLCQSPGFFMIPLLLGSWAAGGGCFGNTRSFLPLFMCASPVRFPQRNGSLIDFLNVRTRLSRNKYLRLTRKGDHHLLKNRPGITLLKAFPAKGMNG